MLTQDYTNCRHNNLIRAGFGGSGKQRLQCRMCGQRFTEGRRQRVRLELIALIAPLWLQGVSRREAAQRISASKRTVDKFYRFLIEESKKRATFERNVLP